MIAADSRQSELPPAAGLRADLMLWRHDQRLQKLELSVEDIEKRLAKMARS